MQSMSHTGVVPARAAHNKIQPESKPMKMSHMCSVAAAVTLVLAAPAQAEESPDAAAKVEEIVVTAQRRAQSIQDVANSIEAVAGDKLDELGQVGFEDYVTSIGGVGFTKSASGSTKIGIRGVSAVTQNDYAVAATVSTVGVYVDDVPVQGNGTLPDLNLYDLQRVEVLKGPQGTLYGDGAMGGAIKMILNEPNLAEFEGKAEATFLQSRNGDPGNRLRGVVNIPLVENVLAARIVGSTEDRKGWIDNVATGEQGVNDTKSWSARASVLGQITDAFSIELLFLHDEQKQDGFPEAVDYLGDLQTDLLENQFNHAKVDIYALTLKYDLGFAELSSVSSKFEKYRVFSSRFTSFAMPLVFGGFASENFKFEDDEDTFSQEVRLSSVNGETFKWTAGLFYRDRQRDVCGSYSSPDPQVPALFPVAVPVCSFLPDSGYNVALRKAAESYEQKAVFGELNWTFLQDLELTLGARYFEEEVGFTDAQYTFGPLAAFSAPPQTNRISNQDPLFKIGLGWSLNDDAMVYFNVAEGFRSGGANLGASGTTDPQKYAAFDPDTLINYELGLKSSWMERRLTFNGALYFSDWSDVQAYANVPAAVALPSSSGTVSLLTSAGDAQVKGVELLLSYRATEQLSVGLTSNYQETEFVRITPGANIANGSELPNAPDLTGSMFAEYQLPFSSGEFFGRLDYRYVDSQRTVVELSVSPSGYSDAATVLSSYDVADFTFGFRKADWSATVFVNNLTDERYAVGLGNRFFNGTPATRNPNMRSVGEPRTMGVTIGYKF